MHLRNTAVVGVVFIAAIFVAGTGAFTAVAADRSATIRVAGDDGALLALTPHASASPSDVFTASGTLKIQVNAGSTTDFDPLFNVTNQGTQPVAVWVEDFDYAVGNTGDLPGDLIGDQDDDNTANITFYNPTFGGASSCENGVKSVETVDNAVEVAPGETLVVSLLADSNSVSSEEADLLDEMVVHADASVTGQSTPILAC